MSQAKRILVGQSGGPTCAINASLAGVIAGAREKGAHAIGMRYGIQGFLDGHTVDLGQAVPDDDALSLLRDTPASWLGSCRFKLPEPDADPEFFARALERIDAKGVSAVLYIGGNDSMDTIAKLARYGAQVGSDVRFVGVPKTIDNDLVGTDHTPGYGSAARFVATAVVARDADVYDLKSVTFVEIMGRDAGWLAGSACLANPDVVLLPEVPLDEDALMAKVEALLAEKNTVMVATSEGVRDASGRLIAAPSPRARAPTSSVTWRSSPGQAATWPRLRRSALAARRAPWRSPPSSAARATARARRTWTRPSRSGAWARLRRWTARRASCARSSAPRTTHIARSFAPWAWQTWRTR